MANELITIPQETIDALDLAAQNGKMAGLELAPFKRSVMIAAAVNQLRQILTGPVLHQFMLLKDTAVGFLTDKGNYSEQTIRDALIEACIAGVYPVGNQFNIISGRCYITKEGFHQLLKDKEGLRYNITPDIPQMDPANKKATVSMKIQWEYRGESHTETIPFVVRLNAGMGEDAAIGKATRKARAWLYQVITGIEIGDGDVEELAEDPNTITIEQKERPTLRKLVPKAKTDYEDMIRRADDVEGLKIIYGMMEKDTELPKERFDELKAKCTQRKEEINGGNK